MTKFKGNVDFSRHHPIPSFQKVWKFPLSLILCTQYWSLTTKVMLIYIEKKYDACPWLGTLDRAINIISMKHFASGHQLWGCLLHFVRKFLLSGYVLYVNTVFKFQAFSLHILLKSKYCRVVNQATIANTYELFQKGCSKY